MTVKEIGERYIGFKKGLDNTKQLKQKLLLKQEESACSGLFIEPVYLITKEEREDLITIVGYWQEVLETKINQEVGNMVL